MGLCKKDITPLLTHWSYVFLALTHRYDHLIQEKSFENVICNMLAILFRPQCGNFPGANYEELAAEVNDLHFSIDQLALAFSSR